MWEARSETVPDGIRYLIYHGQRQLTFRQLFCGLEEDPTFLKWYCDLLAGSPFEAFYWEHPPLTIDSFEEAAEFVLIGSDSLAEIRANPEPFKPQFARRPGEDVVTFANLGGDAMLVAPAPVIGVEAYPHLAAFMRNAPVSQVEHLLRSTGRAVRERLATSPLWLSTAGLGVPWLHVRIDTRPKYYRYLPYKIL